MASYQQLGKDKYKIFVDVQSYGRRRRRTKTVTVKSKRALKRALEDFVAEVKTESPVVESIKFRDFVPRWWKMHVSKLHMRTQEAYDYQLKHKPILDYFGDMKIDEIRAYHVVDFFDRLDRKGVGGLSGVYICLASILSAAEKWDLIELSPMHKVKAPKPKHYNREIKSYSAEQLKRLTFLINHSSITEKSKIEFKIGYLMCLRESEIAGIMKKKINFNDHYIDIVRQLQWDRKKRRMRYTPLKNGKEKRVYFPEKFMPELKHFVTEHKKLKMACGPAWYKFVDKDFSDEPIDLLFTNSIGRPVSADAICHGWIKFIRTTDLPYLNFHGLRHSGISYMLNHGILSKEVQQQAGHSSDKITKDIYWDEDEKKRSADMSVFNEII